MSEFAYSGIGLNPHYGTPCNPCDPGTARSPCGSSSGSGVAVAAGPACHGNDSGGRVPASFNRVVGYIVDRALFDGRRSSASRTLDTLGPLANTVEDCVLVDAALRGILLPEVRHADLDGLRIFMPETVVLDGCQAAVLGNFEAAIERLARASSDAPCRNWRRLLNWSPSTGICLAPKRCTSIAGHADEPAALGHARAPHGRAVGRPLGRSLVRAK